MSKLTWDNEGERLFETGVSEVALYPFQTNGYTKGVAWNGVSSITDSPGGAESNKIYADNIEYLNLMSAETAGGTIEAYMAPDEFAECDGSVEVAPGVYAGQQNRKKFGLAYKTILGNDTESNDHGYKLHLVWGCLASPSEKQNSSVNASPEPLAMSWEYSATPVKVTAAVKGKKLKATATMTFDSTKVDATKLQKLEGILYGTDSSGSTEPRLPMPDEIISMMTTEG